MCCMSPSRSCNVPSVSDLYPCVSAVHAFGGFIVARRRTVFGALRRSALSACAGTVTMNQGYNLRSRSTVDPLETPDPIQRAPAPSPMVRVPLADPDQDMSADLNVPAADGPSVPTSTSDGPPARHTAIGLLEALGRGVWILTQEQAGDFASGLDS